MTGDDDALILFADRRLRVGSDGLEIGRDPDNDLVLQAPSVSRRHARIEPRNGGFELRDLDSSHGVLVNGERVEEVRALESGDEIDLGGERIRFVLGVPTTLDAGARGERPAGTVDWNGERLTIGRDPANDVVVDDPNVSRFHACVVREGEKVMLRDLGSRNGTRLNGAPCVAAELRDGAEIGVGALRLTFEGGSFVTTDDRGAVRLEARGVSVRAGDAEILAPTTLAIEPGELVAVIGRSGCGKTTLTRALAGVSEPSAGEVELNGEPIRSRLTDVGYVPQHEIVHGLLTPREALRYAARLRLPRDTSREEIETAVERTLAELDLEHAADRRIDRLSGGERKRAGVAVELLGRPSLLFLDEPTTGLDPGLERQTMSLLRDLADGSRAVVVVTHATRSLELCDRLCVLGPGGRVHWLGPPREALEHFGVEDYDETYDRVQEAEPPSGELPPGARPPAGARPDAPPRRASRAALPVLVRRYLRLLTRDRRNLVLLLAQAPLLGVAIGALFGGDVFQHNRRGNPNDSAQILFLLVTTTIWLGSIAAAREIVKERSVLARERAVGVALPTYLASKCAVLFGLVALQAALLLAGVAALRSFHEPASVYAEAYGLLVATGIAAVAMGLFISSLARSEDQATSFIPLALLPQLLFAGAIVPVSKMGAVIDALSQAAFSRWAFSGVGTVLDMNGRLAADEFDAERSPYGRSFFATEAPEALAILGAFALGFLVLAALRLRRV